METRKGCQKPALQQKTADDDDDDDDDADDAEWKPKPLPILPRFAHF